MGENVGGGSDDRYICIPSDTSSYLIFVSTTFLYFTYSASKSKQNFIIAPTVDGAPDEMLILDNFNKIQFGGSRKIAVIG